MLKKLIPTIFMLTCALVASASAQTAVSTEKQIAVRELLALISADNNFEDMMKALAPQMQAQQEATLKASLDAQTDLTADQKQALAASFAADPRFSLKRLFDKLTEKFNYNELMNEIAASVYDKHYTLAEIKDLTAFYRTPTGQKSLKLMQPIMSDTMQAMQERLMPKMFAAIKEIADQDKAVIEREINAKTRRAKKPDDK